MVKRISILVIILGLVMLYISGISSHEDNNVELDIRIGKMLYITISETDKSYKVLDSTDSYFDLWSTEEKDKLRKYMLEKSINFKPGSYKINQCTTFEEALKIFKFEN